jgi:hypothetical protein
MVFASFAVSKQGWRCESSAEGSVWERKGVAEMWATGSIDGARAVVERRIPRFYSQNTINLPSIQYT